MGEPVIDSVTGLFKKLELHLPDSEVGLVADDLLLRYSNSGSIDHHFELKAGHLEVAGGSLTCLFGTNGSGKTTLLRTLAGFHAPANGNIRWCGVGPSPKMGVDAVLVAEKSPWPHMTIMQNVSLPLRRVRGWGTEKAGEAAAALLDYLGLASMADRYPHQLSAGQQQRAVLARISVGDTCSLVGRNSSAPKVKFGRRELPDC